MIMKLESTYFGRCGDNCVTEYTELGLPPPGKTGRPDASRSRMPLPSLFSIENISVIYNCYLEASCK